MPDVHITLTRAELDGIRDRCALGQGVSDWLLEAARRRLITDMLDERPAPPAEITLARRCDTCGTRLRKPARGPWPTYCSEACRKRAHNRRQHPTKERR